MNKNNYQKEEATEYNELQKHVLHLCREFELPDGDAVIHTDMDDYVGMIGDENSGCFIIYEMSHPERFCVSINKKLLSEKSHLYSLMDWRFRCYKEMLERK